MLSPEIVHALLALGKLWVMWKSVVLPVVTCTPPPITVNVVGLHVTVTVHVVFGAQLVVLAT